MRTRRGGHARKQRHPVRETLVGQSPTQLTLLINCPVEHAHLDSSPWHA